MLFYYILDLQIIFKLLFKLCCILPVASLIVSFQNQASKLTSAILICDVNVLRYLSVEISFVSQVKVGSENKQTSSGSQKLPTN